MGTEIAATLGSEMAGRHALMLFSSVESYRDAYCHIAKARLEKGWMVVLLPYFETVGAVIRNLREHGIEVDRYRDGTSLVILDAVKQFFGSGQGFADYVESAGRQAQGAGRAGVTVIADITAFHHFEDMGAMLRYEREMQRLLPRMANVSILCCYHRGNFDRLPRDTQEAIFSCHTSVLRGDGDDKGDGSGNSSVAKG